MRTTLILDDTLVAEAMRQSGITEKTAVVRKGLELVIEREAARRLAALGGSMPGFSIAPRKRGEPAE